MKLNLPNWAVNAIIGFAMKNPYQHIDGYMDRYWILPYPAEPGHPKYDTLWQRFRRKYFGYAARVHCIKRSDKERHFHDHPWNFVSVILRGGYYEWRPVRKNGMIVGEKRTAYPKGSVLFRRAEDFHRLQLPEGKDAWTLFITGPKKQSWGFLTTPQFKTYWRDYLNDYTTTGTSD